MTNLEAHVVRAADCELERWPDIVEWRTLVSADRTPTEGVTMGLAEIGPGATLEGARHRHAHPEVYFVIDGSGFVHIDGVAHPIEAGAAVFVPGGAWHCAENTGVTTLRLLYAFAADSITDVVYEFPT